MRVDTRRAAGWCSGGARVSMARMNPLRDVASRSLRALTLLTLAAITAGCAGPQIELDAWRKAQVEPRAAANASAAEVDAQFGELERLRDALELARARELALQLAASQPRDPRALLVASRAESDGVFLFEAADKRSRNHAAASALEYVERAHALGANDAAAMAQLAWALGTSTHLQPMFDRAAHARRTFEAAERALEIDADQPTALATLAMVHWRLETLPAIASAMAFGAPKSSLAAAERFARRACEREPSRENRQILAKVLDALKRRAEAKAELDAALAAPERFPRDRVLAPALAELRKSLE